LKALIYRGSKDVHVENLIDPLTGLCRGCRPESRGRGDLAQDYSIFDQGEEDDRKVALTT
jgi:hypothetical protein